MSKMDAMPEVIQRLDDEIRRSRSAIKVLRATSHHAPLSFDEVCQFEQQHRETVDVAFAFRIRQGIWRENETVPLELILWRLESAHFLAHALS